MEKELVVLGFSVTDSINLRRLRLAWGKQEKQLNGKRVLGRGVSETKQILSKDLGGEIVLVDMEEKPIRILDRVKVPTPMGLYFDPHSKALFTGSDHHIFRVCNGEANKWIDNRLFNCIHGISGTKACGLLITATGIDAILEINIINERVVYSWLATENGYNLQPEGGIRVIDRKLNYQSTEFSTLEHTTHVNSALEYSNDEILATFFHQGELVKINKISGKVTTVLSGLLNPHNIRRGATGFILSDTNGKRVIKFNEQLNVVGQIAGDYDWIQDAVELSNRKMVIADANNGRIVLTAPSGEILSEYSYGAENMRIGSLCKLKLTEARNIFNFS